MGTLKKPMLGYHADQETHISVNTEAASLANSLSRNIKLSELLLWQLTFTEGFALDRKPGQDSGPEMGCSL